MKPAVGVEHPAHEIVQPAPVSRGARLLRGDGDRHSIAPFHRDIGPSVLGSIVQQPWAVGPPEALEDTRLVRDHGLDGRAIVARDLQRREPTVLPARPIDF